MELPKALTTWIEQQFSKALDAGADEVRRLFHGRNGSIVGYNQLVIDWLPNVIVIRLYDEMHCELLALLVEYFAAKAVVDGIAIQERGRGRETTFKIVYGDVPNVMQIKESSLCYQIEPLEFQNFGLFLDMRNGRNWLKENSKDCKVLNLFSYTCAFSVAAISGGAKLVVNVDLSKRALSIGRTNHQLNHLDKKSSVFMPYDMLKSWSRIKKPGPYDVVVIDPPSFQPGSFIANKDYVKVLRRLNELTTPKALVMVCHNDPAQTSDFIRTLMSQECEGFAYQEKLAVPEEFSEVDLEKSIKVLIYKKIA